MQVRFLPGVLLGNAESRTRPDGALAAQGGRVEIRYRADDPRAYRAAVANVKVPESALMGILQSALRMRQLAMVDAEEPGWKQIVSAPLLAAWLVRDWASSKSAEISLSAPSAVLMTLPARCELSIA